MEERRPERASDDPLPPAVKPYGAMSDAGGMEAGQGCLLSSPSPEAGAR